MILHKINPFGRKGSISYQEFKELKLRKLQRGSDKELLDALSAI